MGVVKFCIGAFLFAAIFRKTTGLHEHNSLLSQVVAPVPNVVNPVVLPSSVHHQNLQAGVPAYNNPHHSGLYIPYIPPLNPHNPFLNHQQPHSSVPSPVAPTTNIPPINPQNPFFNHQQPHVGVTNPPIPASTQPPKLITNIPPLNQQNPFLNPQQPHVGVTHSSVPLVPSSVAPITYIPPLNPQNPFLNHQQPHVGVTNPPIPASTQPPKPIPPLNPQNPFLHPQKPFVGVTQPPQLPVQQPTFPVNPPIASPTQPPQLPTASLRSSCLRSRGQFASGRCNTFVNCWEDLVVEQFCPVGLVFNPAGFCDYPYNVNCEGRSYQPIQAPVGPTADITGSPIVLPTTPPSFLPPGSVIDENLKKKCVGGLRGLFASDYCNKYVNCWDGNAVEQDCPPGLLFSSKGYCDFAHNVNCYNRILLASSSIPPASSTPQTNLPPVSLKPNPTHPPFNGETQGTPPSYVPLGDLTDQRLRKKCLGESGLFPSDYCHKFINCWDKFAVEQECPVGLFFSDKGYCDYAYNVNCGNRTIITVTVPEPPASPTHPTNLPSVSLKPKPPQLEVVTPIDDFLTLPTQTKKPETTTPPAYVPSGVVPDGKLKKKCLQPRGQFPSDICSKYVNCWDGYAVEQDCLPGLRFSEKGYCDYSFNVNCNNRTIIKTPLSPPTGPQFVELPVGAAPHQPVQTIVTTQAPPSIPVINQHPVLPFVEPAVQPVDPVIKRKCLGLRGQFPTDSCHKYIDCWDNVAVEHDCPPGLLFSQKGYCDYDYNVNCNNRTVIKATPNSLCPAPQGTFRDRSNCSRYFTCIDNGIASKFECPSGLNFNDVIGVCDYAYRVNCNREPFNYEPLKNTNFLQKIPAAVLEATKQCRPGRVLRLNSECSSVALCRNTLTEVVHCPAGLAYDAPTDRCVHPQLAKCQDS